MNADPKIVDRIRKLLEVKGRTPEEAASYVAKANELAEKNGISMYEVGQAGQAKMATDIRETAATDIFEHGKPQAWRWTVLEAAAESAGVHVVGSWRWDYLGKNRRYGRIRTAYFIGLPLDVEVAGYTYQYLVQEVERLAKEHARPSWDEIRELAKLRGIKVHQAEMEWSEDYYHVHPLKQEASFRKGAAQGVKDALSGITRERQEADTNTSALVVNREAAIQDYLSIKAYGKTVAQRKEAHAALLAKYVAQREAELKANPNAVAKKEKTYRWTKADQRRADAADRKERRRLEAEHNRYWSNVDVSSWSTGREKGREIKIRPGVSAGQKGE